MACFAAVYGADSGRGVVRRDRAVVDDPAAARRLLLHQPERLLRAEERAGQVRVDHGPPVLEVELLERHGRRADAGVVEQQVEAPEPSSTSAKSAATDAGSRTSAGIATAPFPASAAAASSGSQPPAREDDGEAGARERDRAGAADAAARARDDGDSAHGGSLRRSPSGAATVEVAVHRARAGLKSG